MFRLLFIVVRSLFRHRADLVLENLALRQQLAVLKEKKPRPRLSDANRVFWVWLREAWPKWAGAVTIVKPATVVRWHRAGFRWYWRWKSKAKKAGRPRVSRDVRDLIRRLCRENPTWGAPRVHGELLKLGIQVAERTVSRYMPKRPAPPRARQNWRTFLRNHRDVIAAMDFFTVPTITFRVLYVLFVIHHARRQVLHFNVTAHPTTAWVIHQLREAFPFETAPRYLIFDRDSKFAPAVIAVIKSLGIEPIRTAYRSPWQNGTAERWILSCRAEMLDNVIVLGERHLGRLLGEYVRYYREDRTHLTLSKDAPDHREVTPKPCLEAKVVSLPRVGGLHHRYEWRKAA